MRHIRTTLAIFAALAVAMASSMAFAAPSIPALSSIRSMKAVSGTEQTILISGTLPASVDLPATIVLPIPKGVSPAWVGEITGGDPSQDPTASYTIDSGKNYDLLSITVTDARTAQAEFLSTAAVPQSGPTEMEVTLPVVGTVGEATLEYWVPKGATLSSASKGISLLTTASADYDVYSLTRSKPKRGSSLKGTVAFTLTGTPSGAAPSATQSSTSAAAPATSWQSLLGLLMIVAVAGAVGFFATNGFLALRDRSASPGTVADANTDVPAEQPKPSRKRPASAAGTGRASTTTAKKKTTPDTGASKPRSKKTDRS